MSGILWFMLGVFVGGWLGVLLMSMMFIAHDADRQMETSDAQLNETR